MQSASRGRPAGAARRPPHLMGLIEVHDLAATSVK